MKEYELHRSRDESLNFLHDHSRCHGSFGIADTYNVIRIRARKCKDIMRRNNRSKKPSSRGGKNSPVALGPSLLKPLSIIRSTKRYVLSVASTVNIDHKDLLLSGGAICTVVNTTLTALFSSARVRRVRVWSPLSTTAVPSALLTNVCLMWGGSASTGPGTTQQVITASTMSSVHPAYIEAKPPRGTQASWWGQTDTVENLFQVFSYSATGAITVAGAGTVIEVDCEFSQSALGTTTTLGVATGTLGQIYYPTLDSSGSKNAYPVGLPSTV